MNWGFLKSLNVTAVAGKLGGRSTSFFIAFFAMGNLWHSLGRLDATYIGFMTALLGYVVGHSFKDDHHEQAMAGTQNGRIPPPDAPLPAAGVPQ